ncbi:MAG: hypothetical protein ACLP8A_08120 [Methylovirgula sp.]
MRALRSWCGLGVAVLWLSGCNQGTPVASVPAPQPAEAAAPAAFADLPADAPCTEKIQRFQAVLADDRTTGNVEKPVYDQIETELSKAASACSAGRGREALGLVKASEERHGYHV